MKKILIITNHSYMLYQFRKELIQKLLKEHEVVLVMPFVGHVEDFKQMGCRCISMDVDRRGMNPMTDLKLYKAYHAILKKEHPDLVITYSIKPNIYGGMACQKLKIPYCVNVQGLGTAFENKKLAWFVSMLYRYALKKAKVVFFENYGNANVFLKRKIIHEDKICVLNGAGVNLEQYTYQEYPKDLSIHFIFIGRIMKEKGIDEILETARKMKEKYQNKVVFDLVGFFEDEYKDIVEQMNKEGIIVYHGFQQDVKPFLKEAHCLLLPSYHEGMANTILEASSMGRPVIVSNIPGCQEGVIDQESGYLVKVKDSQDLYEKVEKFYCLSYEKKRQMGMSARKLMEEKFDKKKVVEITYKELMS